MLKLKVVKIDKDQDLHETGLKVLKELAENFNIKDVSLTTNENGKPYFINSDLYFNISHSIDTVICVISNREIGVDIEKIRDFDKTINNSLKFNYTNNMSFFKEWTRREAYIKMKGLSLKDIYTVNPDIFINTYIRDGYVISICEKPLETELVNDN